MKQIKIVAAEDRMTHAFQISFDVGAINSESLDIDSEFMDQLEDTIYKFLQDRNLSLLGISDPEDMDHAYSDKEVLDFMGEVAK